MAENRYIDILDLHKSFNGQKVLQGVNLQIPKGKITVIIGPSGCGKTVLLRHVIGLMKPDRGRVTIDGVNLHALTRLELNKFRRHFGMLFQQAALFDSMNVYENVAFPLKEHTKLSENQIQKIVADKLILVGLEGIQRKMPSELSGGMKKRVGLARALALEPDIILYDEPTTGLDPIMTEAIDNLITDMQRKLKVTSVVISHDIPSAFRISDQIAMVYEGKIVEVGAPESFRKSSHPAVQEFLKKGEARF
ncbi:MAG: ABC transporter ATP-binding protein [Deltaproteobacteria bacterium RIFCSPLOWO2_01_44_7]|nr:MAG: ABC transporter ATP-binding protein [Deltaproteobacteria bacterium RIFCSPHIGHO2_01_FULL_43_49]OGQ16418.1 MAG: ABC transporter ATP-binding protein [Deltaproteobacteria bacterium RIFCSPHIGHO2_02_FULL_44_53]OGQ27755.1 MAG: ABC transporter ATP-binding protein [Deltaproteobacteria bacterium RIFCSPHIGHO2_12_FULL_44_21]OGQ32936.1 MAG: ABC transporter ATP-binding protein [Deltaproteobacteria bacterium RIFCSPLOWO2_01_FULL_45_74]OGQ38691.1 MAG: ABC transporter ATP-binding protein [Deltaproteobact